MKIIRDWPNKQSKRPLKVACTEYRPDGKAIFLPVILAAAAPFYFYLENSAALGAGQSSSQSSRTTGGQAAGLASAQTAGPGAASPGSQPSAPASDQANGQSSAAAGSGQTAAAGSSQTAAAGSGQTAAAGSGQTAAAGSSQTAAAGSGQTTTAAAGQTGEKPMDKALAGKIQSMSNLYRQGKYAQAESIGRDILKTAPTNLEAHYLLGNIYFKLNNTKSASQQYDYCVKTGANSTVSKLAAAAMAGMTADKKDGQGQPAGTGAKSSTNAQSGQDKPISITALKRADSILQRAQDTLAYKRKQLDYEIIHSEEFAKSRIKEIPYNTIYRRMSAFGGIEAARDNEDYYTAPNYDRPVEIAKIRSTENTKISRYLDEYSKQEKAIVSTALNDTAAVLGNALDADSKAQSSAGGSGTASASAAASAAKSPTTMLEACAVCGITTHKESLGQRVINVTTGSAAHRAGLTPADLIMSATYIPGADLLKLTIRRSGKDYALQLHPQVSARAQAAAQQAAAARVAPPTPPKPTSGQLAWARIRDSEIVIVEDMSANMRQSLGDTGLSRWDWAAGRIIDFADNISKGTSMGFTLIQCYQYTYELYRDQNPGGLRQKMGMARALDAANVSLPLMNVTSEYLDSHSVKPLLILVFTDGHPERGESLESAVKSVVDRVKNTDQVRFVFFQIGDDQVGTSMLQMLDNDMTYSGHKYDIVDFVSFAELQESGVSRALLDAYVKPRATGKTIAPPMSTELTDKLELVHKKLAEAQHK